MPTDQKVTGLSPVGVTLKINHLQQCRWFFHFRHGKQFRNNFADSYLVEVINITTFGGRKFPPVGIVRHYLTGSIRISTKRGIYSGYPFFYIVVGLGKVCNSFYFVFFARTISRITRSPARISIPCRRGSPPLVRCSASHSVRMRTQWKPAASKADPISDRSLRFDTYTCFFIVSVVEVVGFISRLSVD